jgi:hypothetical protein
MKKIDNLLHRKTGADDLRLDFIAYIHIQIPSKIQIMKKRCQHAIRRIRFAVWCKNLFCSNPLETRRSMPSS